MSRFLWIEDFENGTQTPTEFLWGNYLPQSFQIPDDSEALVELLDEHGIILKLDFWSGWEFIQKNLKEVDYIILDVDLEIGGKKENLLEILKKYNYKPPYENQEEDKRKYRDALKELKKIAGYQLYLELVFEKSFPKQHILFSTNHLGELNSIREAFSTAKLNLPPLYSKNLSDKEQSQHWITTRQNNPYTLLRRGILDACKKIEEKLNLNDPKTDLNDFIQFNRIGVLLHQI